MNPSLRRGGGLTLIAFLAATALTGCAEVPTAEVGDCISSSAFAGEEVSEIPTTACDEPHDLEVYEVSTLPEGDYPGDDAVEELAQEACVRAFEGYVGASYEESELYINFITPSEQTWASGSDREILCLLQSEETTGSFKGSGA